MKVRPLGGQQAQAEPALDQRQIVHAALALLDEVGLEGLTMRSLADRLGIKAASLYWHVRNKQDLLSLLAEEICAPMREPDRAQPWQTQLEHLAREYRQVLAAHRDAARVLAGSGGALGPNRLRLSEIVLRTLLDAGFGPRDAAYAGLLLNDYVVTFALEEAQAASAAGSPPEAASPGAHSWAEALPPNRYPSMIALAAYLGEPDLDGRFWFGVDILRRGLEHLLARSKA